jgi:peptide/nickel transport system permease protein
VSWLAARLAHLLAVVLAVTFATFAMVSILPGDTATAQLGPNATEEEREQLREELGLNDPLPVRYLRWLGDAVTGDLGTSTRTGQPITEALGQRMSVTLQLVLFSQVFALVLAVPMAVLSALRPGSWVDRFLTASSLAFLAVPGYLVAVALLAVFAVRLGWFPTTGYVRFTEDPLGNLQSLVLPAIALGLDSVAMYSRVLRADLAATFDMDHMWLARAKGLPTGRIVTRHAMRGASIGMVTLLGITAGRLIGGTVLIETIFSLPGLGRFTIDAITNRDFVALQGAVVVLTVGFVVVNFAVDIAHGFLDPRIRVPRPLS